MPITTVDQYLAALPEDRRAAINALRSVFRKNLDKDITEGMQYGMIGYYVPHSVFPAGYHCNPKEPLPYACIGSRKGYMTLTLMSVYMDPASRKGFEAAWKIAGKKLDMGAACIRFKKLDDLALDVIAETLRKHTASAYIARYQSNLDQHAKRKSKGQPRKTAKKK